MKLRTATVVAARFLVATLIATCRADIWQWTESVSHHAAVVTVKTRADTGGQAYAGTGTVVSVDRGREPPTCLVVTASHVVETASDGTITWADGTPCSTHRAYFATWCWLASATSVPQHVLIDARYNPGDVVYVFIRECQAHGELAAAGFMCPNAITFNAALI